MLPHLRFPVVPLFSVQLRVCHWIRSAVELMGWIAGIAGIWERGEGWGQADETKGRSSSWEAPASRSDGKRGMSLQVCGFCSLADDGVRHRNGAVQFPELCSLCCPAPALPAACTVTNTSSQPSPCSIRSVSPRQNPFYLSSPPRGARVLQTSLVAGMLAAWEHLLRGICVG